VKYVGIALVHVWRYTVGVFCHADSASTTRVALNTQSTLLEARLVVGTAKAGWRLLRCNPWSRGGVDYA